MSLKDFIIDHGSKGKNRYLNNAYKRFVTNTLTNLSDNEIERWEVYNMVANELVGYGYLTEFDELRYRITDKENPNDVIIDILDNIECTTLLRTLYSMAEIYADEDFHSEYFD